MKPSDFSIQPFSLDEVRVDSVGDALKKAEDIINGKDSRGLDLTAMQGALILKLIGAEKNLSEGFKIAKKAFLDKKVADFLKIWQGEMSF